VPNQIAACQVSDIDATVAALRGRGVRFEEYLLTGRSQFRPLGREGLAE
jgi:hypothetical protein